MVSSPISWSKVKSHSQVSEDRLMNEDIKTKVREFIAQFFQNYELADDEDIFALGFVNSLFAMQLVMFVEKEFQITIDNEDLELDNFRTIDALTRLVKRKTGALSSSDEQEFQPSTAVRL